MTELLGDHSLPMFMATCTYGLLVIVYGSRTVQTQGFKLTIKWWKYALLGLIDATAAYFTILALRYTSVTSWALLQPASFIVIVPISILLLKASYSWKHLLSGLLAVSGLVLLLLSDVRGDASNDNRSRHVVLMGDLCAFLGTSLYGTNSVLVETVIKGHVPQYEVLAMLGVFGCIYGSLACLTLGEISAQMFPKTTVPIYTFTAIVFNFGFYALGVIVLKNAGAATLEISLLATNLWSVLGKLFIVGGFHTHVLGFIFAFAMIVTGVALFTFSGDPYKHNALSYTVLETELPSNPQTTRV